jgi:hypothetical protein
MAFINQNQKAMQTKRSLLFILLLFCISSYTYNQSSDCEFESYMEYQEKTYPERLQNRLKLDKEVVLNQGQQRVVSISIPVKAYIVRQSNGSGGIDECNLRDAFDIANIQFIPAMYTIDVCELEYIDSDAYYNIDDFAEGDNLYLSNNNPNTLNIYFVNTAAGYCGWANFPSSSDRYIMMKNSCAMNTSTLAHEIGHYFGLYHTHQGGNELVNGSNCASAGDLLCDTPADPNLSGLVNGSCVYTGNATDANGDLYVPDPLNLMSYSVKSCRDIFTPDQVARMDYYYNNVRASQFNCSSIVNLCCPEGDSDGDGVCDNDDQCPGLNDNLIGTACDDGVDCTTGETYDSNCNCSGGTSADSDFDGVCDALDQCPGFDDTVDSDGDGIPDGCDLDCTQQVGAFPVSTLSHSGTGSSSSTLVFEGTGQNVAFVISDINQKLNGKESRKYIEFVEVSYVDENGNNIVYGSANGASVSSLNVSIEDPVVSITVNLSDTYDGNGPNGMSITLGQVDFCGAECDDSDGDGVCNAQDVCPGFDDNIDSDGDGIPDGCDDCTNQSISFNPNPLNHSGDGSSTSTSNITDGQDISFSVSGLGSKINGNPSNRYVDVVTINYTNGSGSNVTYGTYSGDQVNNVNVSIAGVVLDISVSLSDGYDGNANNISVGLSAVDYCPASPPSDEYTADLTYKDPFEVSIYPNPANDNLTIDVQNNTCNVRMYSITGEIVRNIKDMNGREVISLNKLAPGIYMLLFESNGAFRTERLIKK